jgi:hypothetical protein
MTAMAALAAAILAAAPTSGPVAFETVARGAMSGLDQPSRRVVRTTTQWAALWKQHTGTAQPAAPRPAIDFKREAVVVVALGRRPSAGWSVEITRVEHAGAETVVHVRETPPPRDALTAQVLTQPYHFVRIPRPRGPVRFVDDRGEGVGRAPLH